MSAVLPTFSRKEPDIPSSGKNNKATEEKDHVHKEGWTSVVSVSERI